jgi:hypothetical protein
MEIIYLFVFFAVIGAVFRIAFGMWTAYHAFNVVRGLAQAYDAAVQQQFVILSNAIQAQQTVVAQQAATAARQRIAKLPTAARAAHEQVLNGIVSKRLTLNKRTGHWE